MKRAALVVLLPLLAACATDGDWESHHNSSDAALQAQCKAEASGIADADARATAFEACMSRAGVTRNH
ncbi:hypothetical protein [Lysobacter claricitrinus]|uniref:hypothetical protein n=1 Tax=Lysobacter claricitrinus TaxID=3367728 RepID=UPI0037DB12A0